MAEGDELDVVLKNLTDKEDWLSLAKVLKREKDLKKIIGKSAEWRKFMNKAIRHRAYGHLIANIPRNEYEPDYIAIVRAAARKLRIKKDNSIGVEELEEKIIVEAIRKAKERFIKKHGEEAWRKIEDETEKNLQKLIADGKIPAEKIRQLKGLGAGTMMTAILAGRLAGFALYMAANQIFFAIARNLGLRIGVAVAGPIIGKSLAFLLGPAGWIIAGLWMFYDLGNTNWRKTISAVIMIAVLRRKLAFDAGGEIWR